MYKIIGKNEFELVYEDDDYSPTPWGFTSDLIDLDPQSNGYLLLCLNYEKGYIGDF